MPVRNKSLIFFNSPSLLPKLPKIPKSPIEIGCNYFAELRSVHHICAYDPQTARRIPIQPGITYWTRNGHRKDDWREVCSTAVHSPQDSGTMAIMLAINLGIQEMYILGCGWAGETVSLFDTHYGLSNGARKGTNHRIQLIRRYQNDFKVKINFVCQPFAKDLTFLNFSDLLRELNATLEI